MGADADSAAFAGVLAGVGAAYVSAAGEHAAARGATNAATAGVATTDSAATVSAAGQTAAGAAPIPPWASPPPPPSLQATREAYNQLINDIDHHMEIRPTLPIGTRFRLITKKPGITTP
ncbi:hypothetical protein NIIDMKKI_59970 [Mycobacterium kansasii]|nr:hypothetical protein NIIDMKKI_59970 [Mycobacterium kansasii]